MLVQGDSTVRNVDVSAYLYQTIGEFDIVEGNAQ